MAICVTCKIEFQPDVWHQKALTCSQKCNELRMNEVRKTKRGLRKKIEAKACLECGTVFIPNKFSWHRQKYCENACASKVAQRAYNKRNGPKDNRRLTSKVWIKIANKVRERDGQKCRICQTKAKRLHVHHIYHGTVEEMNDHDSSNLLTLCGSCHYKFHKINIGQENGKLVVSGLVFDFLKAEEISIASRI